MNNWLILGLGNPDKKYEKTKHNVPWWVLDILENKFSKNKQYEKNEKNHFEVRLDFDLYSLYLVYPSTYVNNSGVAMKDLLQKEKFSLEKTIVISDDIRLEEGRLRIRRKGSSGVQSDCFSSLHSKPLDFGNGSTIVCTTAGSFFKIGGPKSANIK